MENVMGLWPSAKQSNVSELGRSVSVLAGIALMVRAFEGRHPIVSALSGGYLLYRGVTGRCPLAELMKSEDTDASVIQVSLTVNKPINEAYRFWRNLSNLPLFMKHLETVVETSDRKSAWIAALPGRLGKLKWEAVITSEKENELLSWQSVEGSQVENSGIVSFKDAGKFGTEVHVTISYLAPAGKVGSSVAKLFNSVFTAMVREDIKNFRRYIETGEIPTIEGRPAGK